MKSHLFFKVKARQVPRSPSRFLTKIILVLYALTLSFTIAAAQTISVSPLPAICEGTASVTLTTTVSPLPADGAVQFVVDGVNTGAPVSGSDGIYTYELIVSALQRGAHEIAVIYSDESGYTAASQPEALFVNHVDAGAIAKGAGNMGGQCGPFNPSISAVTNGTTSKAATGGGTVSYLWQESSDGINWSEATVISPESSNTNIRFNPGTMTVSTWLRRVATSTVGNASCTAYSNALFYEVYPTPVVSAITPTGSPRVCEGGKIQLSNATAGGVWSSNNAANVGIDGAGLVTGISASAQSSSNISYTVTNSYGCSKAATKTVMVIAPPVLSSAGDLCVGEKFQLSPQTAGKWISSNGSVATVTSTGQITAVAAGSATFTFTGNAAPNCSATTGPVYVFPTPSAIITSENIEICEGQAISLTGNVTTANEWTATFSDGSVITGNGNGIFSVEVFPASNFTYTITSLSDEKCTAQTIYLTGETNVIVKSKPEPPVVVTPIETCVGKTPESLTAEGASLLWYSTGAGGNGSSLAPASDTETAGVYNYYVSQNVNGCESDRSGIVVEVKETCPGLPVTLSEFTGKITEQTILLHWKTASEMNSSRFEIQKSYDPLKGFTSVNSVRSQNEINGANYSFEDSDLTSHQMIYYRLKMIDQDETYSYSRILRIENKFMPQPKIYPNPVSDNVNFDTENFTTITGIKILDMRGNIIRHVQKNAHNQSVNVSDLRSGLYLAEFVKTNGKSFVLKFAVIK